MTPAIILKTVQNDVPEFYKNSEKFKESKEFLEYNEWGLALESLMEMTNDNEHIFSEKFWSDLATCAEKMHLIQQAQYCRQQINKNR